MRASIIASALLLAGCASSGTNPSAAPTRESTVRVVGTGGITQISTTAVGGARVGTVERPIADVWAAVPDVYRSLGIEIAQQDDATGVVGNPGFRARRRLGSTALSRYIDCGRSQGVASADTYEVHFSVLTEVRRETDEKTIISTRLDASARPVNFSAEPVRCTSHGELENRIFLALMIER